MRLFRRHGGFRDLLSPYIDGALTPEETSQLERHLASCEACHRELDALRATAQALRQMPEATAPRSFALTPEQAARPVARPAPATSAALVFGPRLAGAAAAFALAALVVLDLGGLANTGQQAPDQAAQKAATAGYADRALAPVPSSPQFGTEKLVPVPTAAGAGSRQGTTTGMATGTTGGVAGTAATPQPGAVEHLPPATPAAAPAASALQPPVSPATVDGKTYARVATPSAADQALTNGSGGSASPAEQAQGGTRDFGITPALHKSNGSYDQSPEPKYYVEFDKAGHFAWTNIGRTPHQAIVAYSLAFMNHYVKGEPADPILTHASPGVALFRYASEIGNNSKGNGAAVVPDESRRRLLQRRSLAP